jgi:3-oxoacyl-(acyl-carrier-protein) synthase/NAD(P)-dependent dehydrogenase (short-subunit alcohol dehydrogenase family)
VTALPDDDTRELMARALHQLQRSQQRIEQLERERCARIAIVGAACRLPAGIDSPASLWEFLLRGGDGTGEIPADRWDVARFHHPEAGTPGRIASRRGAFLPRVDGFDAAFFGIAPAEAELMDPQQRLLLEVCWHALEDAGVAPDAVRGRSVGVFVGISTNDYAYHLVQQVPPDAVTAHTGTGTSHAVAAGRIAYCLDLRGPCLALDTACSSSLVALHLACQSLRAGECELALVGGVNVMCSPLTSAAFSHARMLSPDGRCKTFAAAADGYARGEGAVALLLARSGEVDSRGLVARAKILGSAVNQDGRSAGLTVPNVGAQIAVVQQALAAAAVQPAEIDVIEAHGTGTALGDPIELQALGAVFAGTRPAGRPLHVSSVKTNFGHTEAAAGALSVLKAMLQLQHGAIAPHLHFDLPNPHVPWASLPFVVPTRALPWPAAAARRCGVSSFGFSGTNAHVVLGGATRAASESHREGEVLVLPPSAADPQAFAALARAWAQALRAPGNDARDLAWTACTGRALLRVRGAVLGRTGAELAAGLDTLGPGTVAGADRDAALGTAAQAFVRGERIDFAGLLRGRRGRPVPAPLYPFQHRRHWYGSAAPAALHADLLVEHHVDLAAPRATASGRWHAASDVDAALVRALKALDVEVPAQREPLAGAATVLWCARKAQAPADAVSELLLLAAELARAGTPPRLCALVDRAPEAAPVALAVRAALRALAAEAPAMRLRWVATGADAEPLAVAAALAAEEAEDEVAVDRRGRRAVRFVRASAPTAAPPVFAADATWLVTGGSGALGGAVARWLIARGARHVVLASRRPRVPEAVAAAARGAGGEVRAAALDVTDGDAVAAFVRELAAAAPPLRGICHCAGGSDDVLAAGLTEARARQALGKLEGALHLHAATAGLDLDQFVCVSSATAWLGNAGQVAYAAANGGVEGLCALRRARGLPALAVAFGPWLDGMAADPALLRRFASLGIRPLDESLALGALEGAMQLGTHAVAALAADWPALAAAAGTLLPPRLLPLVPARVATESAPAAARRAELAALAPAAAAAALQSAVTAALAAVLGLPADAIAPAAPLLSLGLDSLLAVDVRHRLHAATGIDLPLAALLAAPDARAVGAALHARLHPGPAPPVPDALLAFVEGLSDDEARALLRRGALPGNQP